MWEQEVHQRPELLADWKWMEVLGLVLGKKDEGFRREAECWADWKVWVDEDVPVWML